MSRQLWCPGDDEEELHVLSATDLCRKFSAVPLIAVLILALSACGSDDDNSSPDKPSSDQSSTSNPTALAKDKALAAMVPPEIRDKGKATIATINQHDDQAEHSASWNDPIAAPRGTSAICGQLRALAPRTYDCLMQNGRENLR